VKAKVQRALDVYSSHRWNATTRLCGCGQFFEATRDGNQAHKEHRMLEVIKAVSELPDDLFCDQCAGPNTENLVLMERYGGHWDTCPNRAKAILPDDSRWPDSGVPKSEDPNHWSQKGGHP
jgi:hypothetical protein